MKPPFQLWRGIFIWVMIIIIIIICTSNVNAFLCYQETANVSTSCGGLSTGYYKWHGNFGGSYYTVYNAFDGIWLNPEGDIYTNYASPGVTGWSQINITYMKPPYINNNVTWQILRYNLNATSLIDYWEFVNISIPDDCFNYSISNITLLEGASTGNDNYYCINNTGNHLIYLGDDNYHRFAEEAIIWSFNQTIEVNHSYNNNSYETKNETFIFNMKYDKINFGGISGELVYNGTRFSSSKSCNDYDCQFSRTIDLPLTNITINRTFYWDIMLTNSTGVYHFNSTFKNQTISPITFIYCNATYSTKSVNYLLYNETSLLLTNASFSSIINYHVGSGTVKKYTVSNLTNNYNYSFCIYPNLTFTTTSQIRLSQSGFYDRQYYLLDKKYNNNLSLQYLYLPELSPYRLVILEFKDTSLSALIGYQVETLRFYESLGIELSTHIDRTDNFGQVIDYLLENSVKYRFKFYDTNGNLVKTSNQVVISCRYSVCVITFLNDTALNILNYNNITNYQQSFYFDNITNNFVFSWNDANSTNPYHRLIVTRLSALGDSDVCDYNSTDLIGSFSCDVGDSYYSYRASAYREASPQKRIGVLNVQVGNITEKFGLEGVMWSFIILIFAITIGIWYPPAGVILYLVVFIGLRLVGILYAPIELMIAEIAIGVAFIWAFRG